eukprot:976055_1
MFPCFNLFLLVSLIHSQTIDPKSTSEQICISDSVDDNVNGIYYYFSWDSDINGSTYYNYQTNRYLYPWIDASSKYYFVSSDRTRAVGSYCRLSIISKLILNPRDCLSPWQSFNDTQLVNDTNLSLVNCNDICVSDNLKSSLDGTYKWLHFDQATGASVYQCTDCSWSSVYLSGWIHSYGLIWIISNDYKSSRAYSYCRLGIQEETYIFNLEDCPSWLTTIDGVWTEDEGLTVQKCATRTIDLTPKSTASDQICISDSVNSQVNGIYYYFASDSDTNGSSYYNYQTNRYLYPWADVFAKYYFVSSDRTRAVGSYCRLSIISKLILNPRDCLNPWQSFHGTQFVNDTNLSLVNCNDICVSDNLKSSLDGTYKWLHFDQATGASVYQCTDCSWSSVYLSGWIHSYGLIWIISNDYKSSRAYSYCRLGIQEETYIFNLEDCPSWLTTIDGVWTEDEGLT